MECLTKKKEKKVALWCIQICRHIEVRSRVSMMGMGWCMNLVHVVWIKGQIRHGFPHRALDPINDKILTIKSGAVDINTSVISSPWWIYVSFQSICINVSLQDENDECTILSAWPRAVSREQAQNVSGKHFFFFYLNNYIHYLYFKIGSS